MHITNLHDALAATAPVKLQDLISARRVQERAAQTAIAAANAARAELERHDARTLAMRHGDVDALKQLGERGVYTREADHSLSFLGGLSDLEHWTNGVLMAEVDFDGPRRWVPAADVVIV